MSKLTGRYAVVTGAAKGIGRAIAERFLADDVAGIALFDMDADLSCRVFTLTDNGNFIALLAVLHVNIKANGKQCNQDNGQQIVIAQTRQPACVCGGIDNAHCARSFWKKRLDGKIHKADRHVVHHQGEKGLIGIPHGLEEGRDKAPKRTQKKSRAQHQKKKRCLSHLSAEIYHAKSGSQSTYQYLTLTADVPESHLEGRRQTDTDAEQHHGITQGDPGTSRRSECALEHGRIDLQGVELGQQKNQQGTDDKRTAQRNAADQPCFFGGDTVSLDHTNERLPFHMYSVRAPALPPII